MNERLSARHGADLEVAPKIGSEPMRGGPRQMTKTHKQARRPAFDRVVLLLQGGGALGAYQAGVYEALAEAEIHPDWVAGISIGAVNATIIAGNPPKLRVEQLREFWEGVTNRHGSTPGRRTGLAPAERRFRARLHQSNERLRGSHGWRAPVSSGCVSPIRFFHPRRGEATSYYDTSRSRRRSKSLIDFDRMNAEQAETRLSHRRRQCAKRQYRLFRLAE